MVKIIWTQRSLTDLESIAQYISQDSIKYASLTIERLFDATKYLEINPRIGRMVPEMGRKDILCLNILTDRPISKPFDISLFGETSSRSVLYETGSFPINNAKIP